VHFETGRRKGYSQWRGWKPLEGNGKSESDARGRVRLDTYSVMVGDNSYSGEERGGKRYSHAVP